MRSEAALQALVVGVAQLYGWAHYHTHDSRRSDEGWPDLVLCRPPRLVVVELKGVRTRVTPEQQAWLARLQGCGVDARLVRPADAAALVEELSDGRAALGASGLVVHLPAVRRG
jgi:hypothetical protein